MHSISENDGARMMAQWRATGGAIRADAFAAAGEDDGLRAAAESTMLRCVVDDGLEAGRGTGPLWSSCGDDGLAAVQFTVASGGGICTDDGLQAGRVTGMHIPGVCAGDDLTL